MEPVIVIVAVIVLAVGAVFAGRAWAAGDPQRQFRLSRTANSASIVFAFTWVVGLLLNAPLVVDFGIVLAVASAAVAWDTARQLNRRAKK